MDRTHRSQLRILSASLALLLLASALADDPDPVRITDPDGPRARMSPEERLALERRDNIELHRSEGRRAFIDQDGVPLLTNRPEKYAHRPEYTEIKIDYDPIVVPGRFKRRTADARYSASEIAEYVRHYAREYALSEHLVFAVIEVESNFKNGAESPKGAAGLMQLMPGTAREMGITDVWDPAQNIAGGTQYLAKLLKLFKGDVKLALAGYNAGPEKVKKHGGIPPYEETQNYVRKVLAASRRIARQGPDNALLAGAGNLRAPASSPRRTIHFHSGLKQTVDRMKEGDDYYDVELKGRSFRIPKKLVRKVEGA